MLPPTTRSMSPRRSPRRLSRSTPWPSATWPSPAGRWTPNWSTSRPTTCSTGRPGIPTSRKIPTHPLGAYAVSKLAGELFAQAYLDRALVVRTSGVFGPGGLTTARGNFVELMLRLAASPNPIRVVEDHVASPTFAPLLASRTIDLVERDISGLFHIGGGMPISWFQFARLIFDAAGVNPTLLATNEREYRTPARRPKYSALSNAKMERTGLVPLPPLRDVLTTYFQARAAAVGRS